MALNKQERFTENLTFHNLFQLDFPEVNEPFEYKGLWNTNYFKNNHPIVLELGCGKGEYTTGLAQLDSTKNYIGIDHKGARIWRGAKTAIERNINHVAFIRMRIDFITNFFSENEVSEIWITFPEPQMHKIRKRLISPQFLNRYRQFVKKGGIIHLKTDNDIIFDYTRKTVQEQGLEILYQTTDIYNSDAPSELKTIQTFYEKMFLTKGENINYLKFILH